MADPQIRYARTTDGVRIAFYAVGSGPPVVFITAPASHLELEWRNPRTRGLYERLAAVCTLIRYDHRGMGLSDRDVGPFTLDGFVSDIEALVGDLQLDKVMLLSPDTSEMPIAVAFAARHNERVSRLALTSAYPRATKQLRAHIAELKALMAVHPDDWKFGATAVARAAGGWEQPQEWSMAFSELLRAAVTAETFTRYIEWQAAFDVTRLLPLVLAPTLVVQNAQEELVTEAGTREFISLMRDARAVLVDTITQYEWGARWLEEISQFLLGVKLSDGLSPNDAHRPALAVILFADIVDSTALTEHMGDAAFRSAARSLDDRMRTAIRVAGGAAIEGKLLGDGVLAVFTSAANAIDAALACARACDRTGLELHLGLHAGDVIREQNNVFGGAVNIASRISGLSAPGEVLVSDIVRGLARTSGGVAFEDRGEHALKGIAEAVRVYAVRKDGV